MMGPCGYQQQPSPAATRGCEFLLQFSGDLASEATTDYTLNYRGMNLSAGEKQLICLARVLLQESKIVILDKPTAHVDPKTEQIIHETIREKMKNSTVITMTHRL